MPRLATRWRSFPSPRYGCVPRRFIGGTASLSSCDCEICSTVPNLWRPFRVDRTAHLKSNVPSRLPSLSLYRTPDKAYPCLLICSYVRLRGLSASYDNPKLNRTPSNSNKPRWMIKTSNLLRKCPRIYLTLGPMLRDTTQGQLGATRTGGVKNVVGETNCRRVFERRPPA